MVRKFMLACTLASALAHAQSETANQTSISQAFSEGSFSLAFRYRFEGVDQDNLDRDAKASTLRTRLTYHSAPYYGFSTLVEFDNISSIHWDDYNSTRNGRVTYPVVADPTGSDLNQAWLDYRTQHSEYGEHRFVLGRQRIVLDNKRFIGGTNWRQHEQTYDALTWQANVNENWQAQAGYINRVRRVFGPDSGTPSPNFDGDSQYINVTLAKLPFGKLTGYGYWFDLANADAQSNKTFGLRASGDFEFDSSQLDYELEWARQRDHGDNPVSYSAGYRLLDAGWTLSGIRFALGNEVLEGDASESGQAFRTPLAGLHKFQGWTDQFVNTPDAGVDDRYASLGTTWKDTRFLLVFHDFSAESGSSDYGDELGFLVSRGFGKAGSVLFKAARYSADEFAQDTDKFWVQYAVSF